MPENRVEDFYHWFLIHGSVVTDDESYSVTVIRKTKKKGDITVKGLGNIGQSLIREWADNNPEIKQKVLDKKLKLDVVVNSISYLGFMSEKTFIDDKEISDTEVETLKNAKALG